MIVTQAMNLGHALRAFHCLQDSQINPQSSKTSDREKIQTRHPGA